jgi:FkbH-like protein
MILSLSDITFDRVNWQPKSKNINEIIQEANLSMTGIVFIDDSPSECAEVRTNCPGVTVIELSSDVSKRESYIKNFWGFDVLKVTRADIERQKMYHQEKSRHTFSEQVESYADFISGLGLDVTIREAVENDISRISQLTFRTNQFTIGSQGKNEEQMYSFIKSNQVYSVEVRDRFGDYGLVGVISYFKIESNMFINTFLLSCRSLGRGVEHQMASFIGNIALSTGCASIIIDVAITGKNKPLLMFFDDIISRFKEEKGSFWHYQVPPSMMHSVTFNPATYNKPMQALSGANNKPIPSVKETFSDATLHLIAETYSDLDSIVKTISEFRRGKNKLCENEQFKYSSTIRQLPQNTLESGLAVIWTEQLGIDSINLNDNFFDLGGRSIMLPFLINKIKEKTGIDVSLVEFFQFPTISSLATHMSRIKPNDDITKCANKIVEKQRKALNQFKRNLTR